MWWGRIQSEKMDNDHQDEGTGEGRGQGRDVPTREAPRAREARAHPAGARGRRSGNTESSTATTPGGGDRDVFLDTYFEFKKFSTRMHCFVIEPIFESVASFLIEMHYNSHKYLY